MHRSFIVFLLSEHSWPKKPELLARPAPPLHPLSLSVFVSLSVSQTHTHTLRGTEMRWGSEGSGLLVWIPHGCCPLTPPLVSSRRDITHGCWMSAAVEWTMAMANSNVSSPSSFIVHLRPFTWCVFEWDDTHNRRRLVCCLLFLVRLLKHSEIF